MNKKKIILFSIIVLMLLILGIAFFILNNTEERLPVETEREIICYPAEYNNQIYKPLDENSFSKMVEPRYYFKYKNTVYYHQESMGWDGYSKFDKKLNNSDPDTFRCVDANFAKDKNQVYYWGSLVKKADPSTFEPLDWPRAKDKNYYFRQTNIESRVE